MGLTLSDFQVEAIDGIKSDKHVIVSTHTGNGKTLVADYAVEMSIKDQKKIVYTAPIKALCNQKFKQFKKKFGEEKVGLITGDRVINDNAPVLVVTTEILRNMMLEDPDKVSDIRYVVLDEIHYLSDEERGTVWEESIILSNKNTSIIGLSATISNMDEICDWLEHIQDKKVQRVWYPERIIPQEHYYFHKDLGACQKDDLLNYSKEDLLKYDTNHIDLIKEAEKQDLLPALGFVFSRALCEQRAQELSGIFDFSDKKQKDQIESLLKQKEQEYPELKGTKSWQSIQQTVKNGICFHHAGLLPVIKEVVEELFEKEFIKVLYATETFAVGINYPVRTVFFESHRKFDGKSFRILKGLEYRQMSGRAGRRGIDLKGHVFTIIGSGDKYFDPKELLDLNNVANEPIESQFKLSYNTVSNFCARYSREQIHDIFSKSLATFQYANNKESKEKLLIERQKELNKLRKSAQRICTQFGTDNCPIIQKQYKKELRNLKDLINRQNASLSPNEYNNMISNIKSLNAKVKKPSRQHKCKTKKLKSCNTFASKMFVLRDNIREIQKSINQNPEYYFNKDYDNKLKLLTKLKYTKDSTLLPRGEVCSKIHVQELFVTELIFNGVFHDMDEDIINALTAGIIFENDKLRESRFKNNLDFSKVYEILESIEKEEAKFRVNSSTTFIDTVSPTIYEWSKGCSLSEITNNHPDLSEGDFVALCRRILDLYRQIKNAVPEDKYLISKLNKCADKINRDVVSIGL